ncbi:hypothetical protein Tsubulata_042023, partial [Turnera subulata]
MTQVLTLLKSIRVEYLANLMRNGKQHQQKRRPHPERCASFQTKPV